MGLCVRDYLREESAQLIKGKKSEFKAHHEVIILFLSMLRVCVCPVDAIQAFYLLLFMVKWDSL